MRKKVYVLLIEELPISFILVRISIDYPENLGPVQHIWALGAALMIGFVCGLLIECVYDWMSRKKFGEIYDTLYLKRVVAIHLLTSLANLALIAIMSYRVKIPLSIFQMISISICYGIYHVIISYVLPEVIKIIREKTHEDCLFEDDSFSREDDFDDICS